jgi:hypothetical protein
MGQRNRDEKTKHYRARLEAARFRKFGSEGAGASTPKNAKAPINKTLKTMIWWIFSVGKNGDLMDFQGKECYVHW